MKVYVSASINMEKLVKNALCKNGAFSSRGIDPELLEDWIGKYGDIRLCFDLENRTATVLQTGDEP